MNEKLLTTGYKEMGHQYRDPFPPLGKRLRQAICDLFPSLPTNRAKNQHPPFYMVPMTGCS